MNNYIVVRNPSFRFLPRFIRVRLGEDYLGINVQPFFTNDYAQARIFPSYSWADSYVHDRAGQARPGMQSCVIRMTRDAHTIPQPQGGTDGAA